MPVPLEPARDSDLPAIVVLMNAAFRGAGGERGWSTEIDYIAGERTNAALLREEIAGGARYLLAKDEAAAGLLGCVSLHGLSPERWYLGSLTVAPALQNSGFGRKLLGAAEEYAAAQGARQMEITVVDLRDTLLAWYERRGYRRTGETRPFPYGDERFGTPRRDDLKFVVLEKDLELRTGD